MNNFIKFKNIFAEWCINNSLVKASGIIGSYASGKQNPNSDIDVIILTDKPGKFINNKNWINTFGISDDVSVEKYGKVTSVRCFYKNGMEIEFGITSLDWASSPIDKGTQKVISQGLNIIHDPKDKLKKLETDVKSNCL